MRYGPPAAIEIAQSGPRSLILPAMIHAIAIAGAVLWLGLNGLFWYAKPPELHWLLGSSILGVIFFAGFFWYLTRVDSHHAS